MAWTRSGLYVQVFIEMFKQTATTPSAALTWTLATSKIALHSNALIDGTAPINFSSTTPIWANTAEVSGTGWAAGGVLLSAAAAGGTSTAPAIAEGTAGSMRWSMGNVSVAGTTLTGVRGFIIYFDPITAPAALVKAMAIAVSFGADYSTVSGTLGITFAPTGLTEIDITP